MLPDASGRPSSRPWAYLVTFACYGARFHGSELGSADRNHNPPGSPYLPENSRRARHERRAMVEPPFLLDARRRRIVLDALKDTSRNAGWVLHAVHVRTHHAHAVVDADTTRDRLLGRLKGRCSYDLRATDPHREHKWARRGSVCELGKARSVDQAVEYVMNGQGEPLEAWENPRRWTACVSQRWSKRSRSEPPGIHPAVRQGAWRVAALAERFRTRTGSGSWEGLRPSRPACRTAG